MMINDKRLHQSKTFWTGVLSLLIAILAMPEFISLIPMAWLPWTQGAMGVLTIGLRLVTDKPINGV